MTRARVVVMSVAIVVSAATLPLGGQAPAAEDPFARLHFRSIGPAVMSGRVTDFAVYEANPAIFYVATAHSGLWKTVNYGTTFTAQFQSQGLMSIGDVAVSQKTPDLVWIGTGEANNRQSTSWGDGAYKSTDGGRTFVNMGLRASFHINRIVIDPANNDVVFVAAQGSLFAPGGDRGVYRTTDGGRTWKAVLTVDADTGANEVVMDPTNNKILYASTYQRRRSQCCFNGGGAGSGLWKSVDGGDTWTRLTNGVPAGPLGRIGLDIYRRSPNILYALIEAEGGQGGGRGGAAASSAADQAATASGTGIYRSDDAGASWRRISGNNSRPMYFSQVRIDPNHPDRVITAAVQIGLSVDGGRTFASADPTIHDDTHAIWWDPANSDHVMIGTDGGVGISWDGTKRWTFLSNLPIGLFYHVSYDMQTPYDVCGGMQDNDAWCGPSAVRTQRGITPERWIRTQIGDGMSVVADLLDPRISYSETQDGAMQRHNNVTGESKTIRPGPANVTPAPAVGETYRFNWDAPILLSPSDPHVLFAAGNKIFRSTDRGDSWTVVSPDLTTNANRDELTIMGVKDADVRISRNDGIAAWPTIVTFAESPKQPGLYYAGSDDGVVSASKDAGKTWDKTLGDRMPRLPKGAWISEVVPSHFDPRTVYVAADAHRLGDNSGYLWASRDAGATFEDLAADLTSEVVKTLTEDQRNPDVLYVGAETGLFVSLDRGRHWSRLAGNFPTVRVDEITLHPRDNAMIVATHGRALWILDHLEPIQEFTDAQASEAKLFSIPNALEWKSSNELNMEFWGDGFFLGENPPFDAVIQFYLKRPANDLQLKVTDAAGKLVRQLTLAARAQGGIQTACWDLRVEPLPAAGAAGGRGGRGGGPGGGGGGGAPAGGRSTAPPAEGPGAGFESVCGAGRGGGGGFGGGAATAGPFVLPGTYHVALEIDGKTVDTKPIKVGMDPAIDLTDVQKKRYFDIATDLHDLQRRGEEMAAALGPLYTQMTDAARKVQTAATVPATTKAQFDALTREFDAVRAKFGVPQPAAGGGRGGGGRGGVQDPQNLVGRAGALKGQVLAFWEMPSDTLMKQYADVKLALPKAIADANAFLLKAMTMSQTLKKYDIALTVPAPVK
ncbi:MAG TPA: hypothetical protein VLT86_09540 [Vicinamibacterales bacterium]|nr:hypothetical protein [Vicinamibacterales bacterium]